MDAHAPSQRNPSRRDLLKWTQIAVCESALKNYGPNVSYDSGGRLQAAWLDR